MTNVISSDHKLFFNAQFYLTPSAVADSVVGLEGIIEDAVKIMRKMLPGTSHFETRILIHRVEAGSNLQDLAIQLIFGSEKKAQRFITQFRKRFGMDKMTPGKLIGILFIGAVLYVAAKHQIFPNDPAHAQVINNFNNCSVQLNVTPEQLHAFYSEYTRDAKLEGEVVKLIRPNQTAPEGNLEFTSDGDTLSISAIELAAVPIVPTHTKDIEVLEDVEVKNTLIVVRALDLDRVTGWAALVPEVHSRRLPLALGHEVNPFEIPQGKNLYGRVKVVRGKNKKNEIVPVSYILESYALHENLQASNPPSERPAE